MTDDIAGLSERLREDIAQLVTAISQAKFSGPRTGVRVKDPSALMDDLTDAATQLAALLKERDALSARVENLHREHDAEKAEITGRLFDAEARVKELEGNTPKFKRDGDDYLVCEGHHHVDEPCEFERYVPEARALRAQQERDEAYERAAVVMDKKADDLLDAAARLQGYIGATKLAYTEAGLHEQAGTAIKALVDEIRRLSAGPEKESNNEQR